jgi:RimJ/RimL family protein N-acetyltransferase
VRLTTERLVLRPPTLDDLPAWHAIYLDAEKVWYGAPRSSLDENRAKLERQIEHHAEHGFGMCTVELDGEAIGAAGLQHLEGGPEVEVGYRFLEEHWGHGYATESAQASIGYGFDVVGLDRIVAVALESNIASRRVLEKCGLQEIGLAHVYGLEHVKYELRR